MYVYLRLNDDEIEKSMERIKCLMDEADRELMRLRSRLEYEVEILKVEESQK